MIPILEPAAAGFLYSRLQNRLPFYTIVQLLELSPALEKGQQPQANEILFSAAPALQYKITKYNYLYIRVGSVSIDYRLYVIISFAVASAAVLKLYYNKLSEVGGWESKSKASRIF